MVMKASTQHRTPEFVVPAGEFKAKCLRLMDEANITQRPITVTKRGKVVGQFVPYAGDEKTFRSIVGRSPQVRLPANFAELRSGLALDWTEPAVKWALANKSEARKKR